jgi:LEA14-like dessication related protein
MFMAEQSFQEEIARIKRWIKRRRILSALKYTFYFFILIGVVLYAVGAYNLLNSVQISLERPPTANRVGSLEYEFTIHLLINNPTSTQFTAKNIYYKLYLQDQFVGDGFKPYLTIKPGLNSESVSIRINLWNFPSIISDALSTGSVRVRVEGTATVPLLAFGIIPWQEVTLQIPPYEYTIPLEISIDETKSVGLFGQDFSDVVSNVERLSSELESIRSSISSIESKINYIEGTIGDVETLRYEISSLREVIDKLKSRIDSLPEITLIRIRNVERPLIVASGGSVTVKINVEYVLSKPTPIIISVWDLDDPTRDIRKEYVLNSGSGIETLELTFTAPRKTGLWQVRVNVYYLIGNSASWTSSDIINFYLS